MAETKTRTNLSATEKAIRILEIAVEKAANKIGIASDTAITKIGAAADMASNKIANDALKATDVVANNAANAAKITNIKGAEDHDLLIELRTNMQELRTDVKNLKNGNVPMKDFEELKLKFDIKNDKQDAKIEALETKTANYTITMVLYSIAVAFMIGLTIYHIISKS